MGPFFLIANLAISFIQGSSMINGSVVRLVILLVALYLNNN